MTNPNIPTPTIESFQEIVPDAAVEQFEIPTLDGTENTTDQPQNINTDPVSVDEFGDALGSIPELPRYTSDELKSHLDYIERDLRYPAELDEQLAAAAANASRPYATEVQRLDTEVAQQRSKADQALSETQAKYTNTKVKLVLHKLGWGKGKVRKAKTAHAEQHRSINAQAYENDGKKQKLYDARNLAEQDARKAHREQHDARIDSYVESAAKDLREAQAYEAQEVTGMYEAQTADAAYAEIVDTITKADVDNRIAGTPLDPTEVEAIKDRALLARLKQPLADKNIAEWVRSSKDTPGAVLRQDGSASYYAVPKTFKQLGEERFAAKSQES